MGVNMNIKICNKCKGFNINNVMEEINKDIDDVHYEIGCNNMCGIGRDKVVVIVDNKPIVASDIADLIKKIKNLSL